MGLELGMIPVDQWFLNGEILLVRGHMAMSGDTSDCHNWGWGGGGLLLAPRA